MKAERGGAATNPLHTPPPACSPMTVRLLHMNGGSGRIRTCRRFRSRNTSHVHKNEGDEIQDIQEIRERFERDAREGVG